MLVQPILRYQNNTYYHEIPWISAEAYLNYR